MLQTFQKHCISSPESDLIADFESDVDPVNVEAVELESVTVKEA